MEIDLSKNRIFKIFTNGDIADNKIQNLIIDKDNCIIIEYNTLYSNIKNIKPYLKLCNTIASTLDKKNPVSAYKKFLLVFIIFLFFLTIALLAILTITGTGIEGLFESFSKYSKNQTTITIAGIAVVVLIISGIVFELGPKIKLIKNLITPSKLDQLNKIIDSNNLSINGFSELSQKWFIKRKSYVFILHYLNWEIDTDKENNINNLVVELLKRHENLKLIFSVDKADGIFRKNDALGCELEKNKLKFTEFEILKPSKNELLTKAKNKNDAIFYNGFLTIINSFNPNEFEIESIAENFELIYNDFQTEKNIIIEKYIQTSNSDDAIKDRKNNILVDTFFNNYNCFNENTDKNKEILLFTVLYHYYFFERPVCKDLLEKVLIIYDRPNICHILKLNTEQILQHLIQNDNKNISDYVNNKILNSLYEGLSSLSSVEIDDDNFGFNRKIEQWLIKYVIINRDDLFRKLKLKTNYYTSFYEYVKYFLFFFDIYKFDFSLAQKLLLYLNPQDIFFYQLYFSSKFSQIPFEKDRTGEMYLLSSSLAQSAWINIERFDDELSIDIFGMKIKFKSLNINPYNSLLQIISDSLGKVRNIDISISEIENIVNKLNSNAHPVFNVELDDFIVKYNEIIARHRFYLSEFESEQQKLPVLNLMKEIEDELIILLPLIEENFVSQIPTLNISKYFEIETPDLDFLFLQITVTIHNNFFNNGKEYVQRNNYNENEISLMIEKLVKYETLIAIQQKKSLNYKEYCYYTLYETKYYIIVNLFKECKLKYDFKYYNKEEIYNISKFKVVVQSFEFINDYFGILDTLFWECWFETRLSLTELISKDNQIQSLRFLNKKIIEDNLKKIQTYTKNILGYVHFDCGLIYIGIISDSVIEPPIAYEKIHKFLSEKGNIPKFIQFQLLNSLHLICHNGQFADKDLLTKESIAIQDDLLDNYSEFITPYQKFNIYLSILSLLISKIDENKNKIESLFQALDSDFNQLNDDQKGLYYYRFIEYMCEINKFDVLIENNSIPEAKRLLKNNKFYYIQFLRNYIDVYYPLIIEKQIELLNTTYNEKIKEHNLWVEKIKNDEIRTDIQEFIVADNKMEYHEKINSISKDLEYIKRQIISLKDNDQIKELEKELDDFVNRYEYLSKIQGDNFPNKYVIASTALVLAKKNHDKNGFKKGQAIKYYEISMKNYFELKEYIPFLKICLELKPYYYNNNKIGNISELEKRIEYIIQVTNIKARTFFSQSVHTDAEQLSIFIYDFFNPNLVTSREDYSFFRNIEDKLDKNKDHYRFDNDTKGLRKLFSDFYNEISFGISDKQIIRILNNILDYSIEHLDTLTFDDIRTIENSLKNADKKLSDNIDFQESKIELEKRLADLSKSYKNRLVKYFENMSFVSIR